MSPVRPSLVALVLLAVLPVIAAGASAGSTTAIAPTTITIDGVTAGAVLEWEGGDPRASVVPGPASSDGTATKQPGAPVCTPLVVKCALPPAGPMQDWLAELCSNKTSRRKIVLTDYDAVGNATGATEFEGAMLAEVHLPALDASSTTPADATYVFAVEQSRDTKPFAATRASTARATSAMFRLAIDGLEGTGVFRIEPIIVSRGGASAGMVGTARDYTSTSGAVEFSNLTVTLSRARSATWRAWFTDFVINGNGSDKNEKSGALELLSADMKQVVFALRFERMGILRVSRVNVAAGAPELDQAELYFEGLSIGTAATSGGTTDSATETGGDGTQEATSDTGGVSDGKEGTTGDGTLQMMEAVPVQQTYTEMATGMLSTGTATDTSGTTTLNLGDRLTSGDVPGSDSTLTQVSAGTLAGSTSIATTTTTNPADQGSRDPAGFPRVEGLTRLDFSGQYHTTSTSEESHYTTPDKIYDLLARIDAAAKAAGWTQVHFSEGSSQGEKWVTEQWKKDPSYVALEIDQPEAGITRYWIRVTTQIPETN